MTEPQFQVGYFCAILTNMDIEQRNALRADARLPLLDPPAEEARLANAREQALFESYFEQERHRFVHLWADRSQNFWTKMGIWNAVRKKLREEMQTRHD
jgi:hypothetical protein